MSCQGFSVVLVLLIAAPAVGEVTKASRGRMMWSAFECAAYAELAGNKDQQKRLFELGYREGKAFLDAAASGSLSQAERDDTPVGVLFSLGGPSIDFMLGHIYANASHVAFDTVVKQESDGTPVHDPLKWAQGEVQRRRAEQKFRSSNCTLVK